MLKILTIHKQQEPTVVRVWYPRYHSSPVTTQNSRYDSCSPAAHGWRTLHCIPKIAPSLQSEGVRPPTKKELISVVIHTFTLPSYDRSGRAGFHHLFTGPSSLNPGLQSNAPGGFQQWITIASTEALNGG
jgi:hypothetical protein